MIGCSDAEVGNHLEEAYVSTSRTKALQSRERDSFVGPQEAVAMEQRALWRG